MENGRDNSKYYKSARRDNKEQTEKAFYGILKCPYALEAQRQEHTHSKWKNTNEN